MKGQTITSSKCTACSRVIVPPRETCPYCGKSAGPMEQMELPNRGIVQSYTTLQMPPQGFKAPLLMALVELKDGALILCLAREQTGPKVEIGDQVEIVTDSEGRFCFQGIS